MRNLFYTSIALFYLFGSLCLPMGNFSFLSSLPEMYRHCKTYEDKDMNAIDFITDHLINIDGIFDKHDHGDNQKPHNFPATHIVMFSPVFYAFVSSEFEMDNPFVFQRTITYLYKDNYIFSFVSFVFHPPKYEIL